MKLRFFLKQHGQTAIEYVLMLAVSASMGVAVFKKFDAYLYSNPDSYINNQMKIYKDLYDPQKGFKRYSLPR